MKPGTYTDMPFDEYKKVKAFSNTWANALEECPAMLKYLMQFDDYRDTPALRLGRAVHEAVFEPRVFGSEKNYISLPRKFGRTKAEQEAKDLFELENQGKTILTQDEWHEATDIAHAVLSTKTASTLIASSKSEVSIFWHCPETNVLCKGRLDAWNKQEGVILDLKTTSDSLNEHSLKRVIATRKYYRQLAWYSYGLDLLGEPTELQILIFVQKRNPYPVAFKSPSFSAIEQGKREMKELTKQYAKCLESDKWPGYPDSISTIELPDYAKKYDVGTGEDFNAYTDFVHEELVKNG